MKKNKKSEAYVDVDVELTFSIVMFLIGIGILLLLSTCEPTVTRETHNGHKYLVRRQALDNGSSMVHDPDCYCFKKDAVEGEIK